MSSHLSSEQYLSYLSIFNEFPNEPSELRDLCFDSMLDSPTTTLILTLAETVLEAQALHLKTAQYIKYCDSKTISIEWRNRYCFLKTFIDWWMTTEHYSDLQKRIAAAYPYSATYYKYNKKTGKYEKKIYADDLLKRVEHYSDMLIPISHSLTVLYD